MKDVHNRCWNGKLWFVRDVCGMICALFTYILITFAQYVILTVIIIPEPNVAYKVINLIMFEFFTFLAFSAHLRTMFTDPGAVPRGTATKEAIEQLGLIDGQVLYKCTKCCSIKPERAHHCSVCQRCIRKMDHHCPWVNNCVGENNQKFFVLFTLYIAVLAIHALLMVFNYFMKCVDDEWKTCGTTYPDQKTGLMVSQPTPVNVILLICLVFEGLLFAIFTCIMFGVQMQAIWNDETGIEQLKKESSKRWNRRQRWRSIRAVFGLKGFSIYWFSPFTRTETIAYADSNYTV
ncbi:hypothetical protein RDWZM_007182 [Blomia tropicalis]|uniref:Palmitoyltransferase n=1 Tax=Blomia tropicalis TaxID=40697 RepID=A0A9Q0M8Y9_BLOTA|nr:Palmitoyltransferase zdhhc7 [Blomia tropicalis]KAJ6221370.1 hypothetical protein RDWZM_007182 [Blomia tropicalis]